MDGNTITNDNIATANNDAGDAVGVSKPLKWYVAVVSNNTEKVCAERIAALGYDTYVPTQKELRRWKNGRRKIIDRIVIHAAVFVRSLRPTVAITLSIFPLLSVLWSTVPPPPISLDFIPWL